ncbi:hypothetical protein T484DRAFT_1857652, partial [Baffinella frigidus]
GNGGQSASTVTLFAHLSQICSKDQDLSALRAATQAQQDVPCLPFLEPFLADLTRVHKECGPDTTPQGLLNLPKARRLASSLKRITRHQHWRYSFPPLLPDWRYSFPPLLPVHPPVPLPRDAFPSLLPPETAALVEEYLSDLLVLDFAQLLARAEACE